MGKRFEDLAAQALVEAGWEVVERNTRYGRREIDLVVRRGAVVAFVEVKGRRNGEHGDPLHAITRRKRAEIEDVARYWIARHGRPGDRYRFDAVAVRPRAGGGLEIEHVEDAWRCGWR